MGIDLATEAAKTGVVEIRCDAQGRWSAREVAPTDDDSLVEIARRADVVALDCPLGWPMAFVEAVSAHHRRERWSGTMDRRPLTHRVTDDLVRDACGRSPLSVSANLLGSTAMRGALLQDRWAAEVWRDGGPRDGSGRLVEVYPAASLHRWGVDAKDYKHRNVEVARTVRQRVVRDVRALVPWLDLGPVADRCITSDDVLDGLLCALIGVAHVAGATDGPQTDEHRSAAIVEGWIRLPTIALEELAPPGLIRPAR